LTPRRNWQERPRASEFLASGGAHLFFIDADIGFTPDWTKERAAVAAGNVDLLAASVGYVAVSYVGTGFMLLRRRAVRQVVDARPELHARPGDLGGEIFADFQGRLTHVGAMAFSGSLIDAVKT
jgi:hypothetical protein